MKTETPDVMGKQLSFDDGRVVALFDLGDEWALGFVGLDKQKIGWRLTAEAMAALVRLYIEAHDANAAVIEDGAVRFGRWA